MAIGDSRVNEDSREIGKKEHVGSRGKDKGEKGKKKIGPSGRMSVADHRGQDESHRPPWAR